MKRLRRSLFLLALIVFCGLFIARWLIDTQLPNHPAGRRLSSETVLVDGTASQIGMSAELVLSKDLSLPNNNTSVSAGQQCICSNSNGGTPSQCGSCFAFVDGFTDRQSHMIPDFVSPRYIADSKNVRVLSSADYSQLQVYAEAAQLLDRPLWVYVRVNTEVAPQFDTLIESTGGGVVHYFTYSGYDDPIASDFEDATGGAGVIILILGLAEITSWPAPRPRQPRLPRPAPTPMDKMDALVAEKDRLKDRVRRKIDIETSRDDF